MKRKLPTLTDAQLYVVAMVAGALFWRFVAAAAGRPRCSPDRRRPVAGACLLAAAVSGAISNRL